MCHPCRLERPRFFRPGAGGEFSGCSQNTLWVGGPCDSSRYEGWPAIYSCYPENVVDLHAKVKQQASQVSELRVTFYGMKGFDVCDPGSHILWFGQETDESPTPGPQSI